MPKSKKHIAEPETIPLTAPQETRPTDVQESKPHIPWTIPDVTAAIGNIMPRLQAVGIVSAHLDDQHRSHVDGHPTPRIKLTNKHGVELPFGDFSCVEKWLAEQESKQPTAPQHTEITREDIEHALLRGTGFRDGKQRVIEQFAKHEGMIKNADFLKKEYGTGGWSHAFADCKGWLDHDGKGITLTLGDLTKPTDRKLIPWTDAAAIIDTLITHGKYTADTPQETKPTAPQQKQETKPAAPAKKPEPAPQQETKPTAAPKKPQEKQTPAESLAASARKAAPKATVEIKGAQTSCPIAMKKITYTPEQAERIETIYHKLKYALDCIDDLRDALSDVSGNAEDGLAVAQEMTDPAAKEYFTRFVAALHDVNFARDDLRAALAIYNMYLGIRTDPSQYNRGTSSTALDQYVDT